jgi:ABC-2 type transport system ATP-binding protein
VAGELAVEVRGLVKRFGGRVTAVDQLNLLVRRGETYGLLGPNGAGKTTTIRILLGLVRADGGLVRVLGLPPGRPGGLRRIGAMSDTAFYPFLSGRDNLRAAARRCSLTDARVDAVLEATRLTPRARDRVSGYSTGMRQRLAVAAALLKDPELLVLDEPSSGLDPAGQLEMRALIRDLARQDRTILLSSHDMAEVEDLCGRVAVIGGGTLLAEGSPAQLRGPARRPLQEVFLELTGGRSGGADSLRPAGGGQPAWGGRAAWGWRARRRRGGPGQAR